MKLLDRIKIYKKIKDTDVNIEKKDILGQGWQGTVYKYIEKRINIGLAVKKIYLNKKQSKYINDPFNSSALKYGNYIELLSHKLINEVLLQKISQNFIFNYNNDYNERHGVCSDIYPHKAIFYNELIKDAIIYEDWVEKEHSLNLWFNAYFQIISSLFILQKYFNMTHFDLHAGNILVQKVKKGGYWQYIINNKKYNVPNLGYIFYINDFGQAFIPNLKKTTKKIDNSYDIKMLFKSTFEYSTSSSEFKKKIKSIIKNLKQKSFDEIIDDIWGDMYDVDYKTRPIEIFKADKLNLPYKLKKILSRK
jgi:hypothetical protein